MSRYTGPELVARSARGELRQPLLLLDVDYVAGFVAALAPFVGHDATWSVEHTRWEAP